MIRKICRDCGSVTIRKTTPEGNEKRFCERCDAFAAYVEAEMDPFCPDCGTKITVHASCCSLGYTCDKCSAMKSSKKVIWKRR